MMDIAIESKNHARSGNGRVLVGESNQEGCGGGIINQFNIVIIFDSVVDILIYNFWFSSEIAIAKVTNAGYHIEFIVDFRI